MIRFIIQLVPLVILMVANLVSGQDFTGTAIYESKTQVEGSLKIEGRDMDPGMQKQIEERMKKAFEKTYVLQFNRYESVFEEEKKIDPPSGGSAGMTFSVNISGDLQYKNIREKMSISQTEFFGKDFLIVDSLPKYNWVLTNEMKKIGNYTCYKAEAIIPVTEEQKRKYEESVEKQASGKTQIFRMEEPKEKVIVAWYTPEIPVNQGPSFYWGLPGLILEIKDERTIFLCSKLVLNPKEKVKISRPKKGQKVTGKEYEEIIQKRMEQSTGRDGSIIIQMGG